MAFLSRSVVFPFPRHARRSKHSRRLGRQAAKPTVETMEARTLLSLFTVSNTGDNGGVNPLPNAGTGTLRQAIVDSNAAAGPNVIDFSLGGGGHKLITLASTLPEITNTVTIDGTSQPGSVPGTPSIEVSGNGMTDGNMMTVSAPNCTIKGLVLNDFLNNYTLLIKAGADNAVVQGNYFGTDATGSTAVPNYAGIGCFAHNITIGGTTAAQRNVISGSQFQAIFTFDDMGTTLEGNSIGTNAAGTAPIPNLQGILVYAGSGTPNLVIGGTAPGTGNLISGNFQGIFSGGRGIIEGNRIGTDATGTFAIPNTEGIHGTANALIGGTTPGAGNLISGNVNGITSCDGSTIQGNLIGTDVSGTAALPNTSYGIGSYVSNCLIGGTTPAARNVISGNHDAGIGTNEGGNTIEGNYLGTDITGEVGLGGNVLAELYGVSNSNILNNLISTGPSIGILSIESSVIQGNLIGTNKEGTGTIGNVYGLFLDSGSRNNTIGGPATGQGNVIAGNIHGINFTGQLSGPAVDYHTVVQGNFIGTTSDGMAPLGNSTGIFILGGVTGVTIGGTTLGSNNVIANNGTGISVRPDGQTQPFGIKILGNSIYGNTDLGIDLNSSGVTVPNDLGDTDAGPNALQNFPVLTTAAAGPSTTVIGTFNSTANDTFRLEFFASTTGAPSGYGQGQHYLGYTTVTTDGSGNASFNVSGLAVSNAGEAITATATVLTGSLTGSTSEFSAWLAAVLPPPSSLSGIVFSDFNNDGQVDFGEKGIVGVPIALTGTDFLGNQVSLSQTTDSAGTYIFLNLLPGSYTITETQQPVGYTPGLNTVGTGGGTVTGARFNVSLTSGENAMNYNYGEQPVASGQIRDDQTASIGFWNNKHGQALIKALNGGVGTQLGNWLAASFPHMFGALSSGNNLAGKNNASVASFFQSDFLVHGQKLDAQVLATALSVYVTNATLDNTGVGSQYDFIVAGNGVGTAGFNVGGDGAAFGVANNTTMTVMDLLLAADAQSVNGVLYNGNNAKRNMANDVFSDINDDGDD